VIDRVEISVRGGNGGAGAVSFRREKSVSRDGVAVAAGEW
jgi:GTPase involved in cell partitioning and DNA repair